MHIRFMADESRNVGIEESWTLVEFARANGKMKVTDDLVNSNTGEVFKSCAFVSPSGSRILVGFSSKLDSINTTLAPTQVAKQIAAQKDNLQVVKLASGFYKLCKSGDSSWADVDLGL